MAVKEDDRFAEFDTGKIRFRGQGRNAFPGEVLTNDPFTVCAWPPKSEIHLIALDPCGDEVREALLTDDFSLLILPLYYASTGDAELAFVEEDAVYRNHTACNPENRAVVVSWFAGDLEPARSPTGYRPRPSSEVRLGWIGSYKRSHQSESGDPAYGRSNDLGDVRFFSHRREDRLGERQRTSIENKGKVKAGLYR